MNLQEKINQDMVKAMKEKNMVARDVLRVIKGEIERASQGPTGKIELNDADVVKIVKKSIEGIKETTNDAAEISVLEGYMPKQMSEEEIKSALAEEIKSLGIVSPTSKDFGTIMKSFTSKNSGAADGKMVSTVLKQIIG